MTNVNKQREEGDHKWAKQPRVKEEPMGQPLFSFERGDDKGKYSCVYNLCVKSLSPKGPQLYRDSYVKLSQRTIDQTY